MSIAALYASPLQRATATAQALVPFAPRPIEFIDDLREINCGDLDGLPIAEVKTMYRDVWKQNLRQDNEAFRWPGGESYREFRDRCLASIERIASTHQGERVAVVTHAGVISQIVGFLHGLSAACWEPFRPGIGSVSELEWSSAARKIIVFGDRAHLKKAEAGASPPN